MCLFKVKINTFKQTENQTKFFFVRFFVLTSLKMASVQTETCKTGKCNQLN
jgi:hypothetical protein